MLILTRKIGESIIINDDIKIQILDVRGKQIRIGIQAPESVLVLREELHQKNLAKQQTNTLQSAKHCLSSAIS